MPRTKNFDTNVALEDAMNLFWEKGYEATSLADLTEKIGIGKGSFYDTFKGKRELFERSLSHYRNQNLAFMKEMLKSEKDPKKGIRKLFEMIVHRGLGDEQHKGCFMSNVCAELGGRDRQIQGFIVNHEKEVAEIFSNYLEGAKLKKGMKPDQVSRYIMTLMTGLNQEVKVERDPKKLLDVVEVAMDVFE